MAQPVRSFIEVPRDSHFPIQNLPFGVFQPRHGSPRIGVAIGNLVLDLSILEELGYLDVVTEGIVAGGARRQRIFGSDSLNAFMALGRPAWKKTRDILQHLLAAETATLRDNAELRDRVFVHRHRTQRRGKGVGRTRRQSGKLHAVRRADQHHALDGVARRLETRISGRRHRAGVIVTRMWSDDGFGCGPIRSFRRGQKTLHHPTQLCRIHRVKPASTSGWADFRHIRCNGRLHVARRTTGSST